MDQVTVGRSGLSVSPIAFSAWQLVDAESTR
jgi:aryl-alcohol dehydrogenase-like predicted oxidoreductase